MHETSAAACPASGSGSGSTECSSASAYPIMTPSSTSRPPKVKSSMIACRVFSARGPNSRAAGTTRSVSWEIGACQNGRKPPAVNRIPKARPRPDSARVNKRRSTPNIPAPDASKTRCTFGCGRTVCSCGGRPRRSQRGIQ
jgi:hypothetical protein